MKTNKFFSLIIILICCFLGGCKKDMAGKTITEIATANNSDKIERSVTVIIDLNKTPIKSCVLQTSDNLPVATWFFSNKTNNLQGFPNYDYIVFNEFDSKTDNSYKDKKNFTIILIDRYDFLYKKNFTVNEKGGTQVSIDKNCRIKQPGDWKRIIERFLNQ